MFKLPPPKQKSQIQIQRQGWFGFEKPAQFSALPSLISLNYQQHQFLGQESVNSRLSTSVGWGMRSKQVKKVKSRFSALGQQHYKQTQPTYLTPAEKQETWHKCRGEPNYMIHANYYYYATYKERHQVKHFMKLYLGLNSICWIVLSYLTSKLLSNLSI